MGPLITDSGGFQVFSLKYGSVYEDLATDKRSGSFNSELDKSKERGEVSVDKSQMRLAEKAYPRYFRLILLFVMSSLQMLELFLTLPM